MKQNILQNMIGFIFKYIWIFCILLVVMELLSVTFTTSILIRQSALGVMQSVSGEVSGRVDGVLRLLNGMAKDTRFADTSKPLFDRAIQALPYQESYNLYMIALTDEEINVVSADEKEPSTEKFSLAYRDYMQRMYATGERQITDAFLSGDGKDTMNYTIAVPIMNDETVAGSVFASIYFKDIEDILDRQSQNSGRSFYILGADNTVMAGEEGKINGKSFMELSEDSYFLNSNSDMIKHSFEAGNPGQYWEWSSEGLTYAAFQRIAPTNWTILYRVQFTSVFTKLVPALLMKICFYVIMCTLVYVLGRRYLKRHLAQVNHLLNRMSAMQTELFQTEQPDYDNLLELTQQGLIDQLTGLATRAILFKKMTSIINTPDFYGAVVFIDLDDLKRINDNFGHEGGDCALIYFAQVLKEYEKNNDGIAARYGGDEFVLILNNLDEKTAGNIARSLCRELNTTVSVKDHKFTIHGSLGIAFYPKHGTKLEELICKADLALYSAKQKGKNQCSFFDENSSIL